jgi:hypothetical protein
MCHPTFGQALVLLRLEIGGKNHSTCRKLDSSFRESLGISIYNMRQGEGIRCETLFRDETVGALDATNAKEYVRMLRRAMDLGGFHQVIFICHTPLVWELGGSVLSVGGARVCLGDRRAVIVKYRPPLPEESLFTGGDHIVLKGGSDR